MSMIWANGCAPKETPESEYHLEICYLNEKSDGYGVVLHFDNIYTAVRQMITTCTKFAVLEDRGESPRGKEINGSIGQCTFCTVELYHDCPNVGGTWPATIDYKTYQF